MMPNIASSLPPSWLSWRTPCELLPSRREGYFRWLMLAAVALAPWAGFVPLQYLLPAYAVFFGQAILLLRRASTSAPISVLQQTANGWRLTDERGEIYLA
jgi:membrane protein implicated in regulation of membrane protease activity